MANLIKAMPTILAHEGASGEYTDAPGDAGGPTRWGVTLATLSHWRKKPCTADDVKNLTLEEASQIYDAGYWDTVWGDKLVSQMVATKLMDIVVNMGLNPPRHGGEVIQKALNMVLGQHGITVPVTGRIDHNIVDFINNQDPKALLEALRVAVANRYHERVAERADQVKWLKGWLVRADCTGLSPCRTCRALKVTLSD